MSPRHAAKDSPGSWRIGAPILDEWPPVACDPSTASLFDTPAGNVPVNEYAERMCTSCKAREHCLSWAIATDEREGIYGGFTYNQRKRIKAWRRKQVEAASRGD